MEKQITVKRGIGNNRWSVSVKEIMRKTFTQSILVALLERGQVLIME